MTIRAFGRVAAVSTGMLVAAALSQATACSSPAATAADAAGAPDAAPVRADAAPPPWLSGAKILVSGPEDNTLNCRKVICRHNENTDLTSFGGGIYLVHRTAMSQILGPNSALHVYKTTDGGNTFTQTAVIPAPSDRDIRDPCFYQVGGELYIKALTRLPVVSSRDSNVDTVAVATHSSDGVTWSPLEPIGPHGWSFWRIKKQAGVYYTAAYQDGDLQVVLFSSTDGVTWTMGAPIYTNSEDTPLETELSFMPSGRLLALVRMDGTDQELLGDHGRLRTKICWAQPPYTQFSCPSEFDGQRLDGPVSFFWRGRLFVVARKHLSDGDRKRTDLFEITGNLDGGPLQIKDWGELPSAGDTSYAGVAMIDSTHALVSWYSSDIAEDPPWSLAMFGPTDIWQGTIDLSKLN